MERGEIARGRLKAPAIQPRAVSRQAGIAAVALVGILAHLVLRFSLIAPRIPPDLPLQLVLALGGTVLVVQLAIKLVRRQFGSDLLAGISIVTAVLLGEYLAGSLVVLMLSGGQALESACGGPRLVGPAGARAPDAVGRASPDRTAGSRTSRSTPWRSAIALAIFPHEICPVDGTVVEGHGSMDESYLTGEPFVMSKAPGTEVLSGAINGEQALDDPCDPPRGRFALRAHHERDARVGAATARHCVGWAISSAPSTRRLPSGVAVAAWWWSGDPIRFLAVLVVATPCPLLIAIPVAIIGSISLAARRGIVVRDPSVLEQIDRCRTIVLDKTGTLTYGEPTLTDRLVAPSTTAPRVLQLAASVERYSRHPLAPPILAAARADGLALLEATDISERPGEGLEAVVDGHRVQIVGRRYVEALGFGDHLPESTGGLECMVVIDGRYAGTFRFRDAPRDDSRSFIGHLWSQHHFDRVLLVSGDREAGGALSRRSRRHHRSPRGPELRRTRSPSPGPSPARAPTLFIGDGINDAPALATATVGIAFGNQSEITSEAAGVVIMDTSLKRVDEFFHIGRRMRRIALQSAVGGMALSVAGMLLASAGYLPPVAGADPPGSHRPRRRAECAPRLNARRCVERLLRSPNVLRRSPL